MLGHFAFQPAAGLEVQGLVDRLVAHPHTLVVREVLEQPMRDLLGRVTAATDRLRPRRARSGWSPVWTASGGRGRPRRTDRPDTAGTARRRCGPDLPRHRRGVLADPGSDRVSVCPASSPSAIASGPATTDTGSLIGLATSLGGSHHCRCVARTGRVIHDRAVGMNPRVAALADAITPIPASAFVDPDLPSRPPC